MSKVPAGELVPLPGYGGVLAFVPAPVPPPLSYSEDLALLLADAERAMGGVEAIGGLIPDPWLFARPLQRLEAVVSSRIEGIASTVDEVFHAEAMGARRASNATQETIAYRAAMDLGLQRLQASPEALDLGLVQDLHRALLGETPGGEGSPGRFREVSVWLAPAGRSITHASYVPPPWAHVPGLMAQWEQYVRACIRSEPQVRSSALIQCAVIHAQFELIHPFRDGNGRMGRLIMVLFLMATGRLSTPSLLLSGYLERHRADYYSRLRQISSQGDWEGWLRFFLQGVAEQSRQAVAAAHSILDLRDRWRRTLQQAKAATHLLSLADRLFENPYITIRQTMEELRVSFPTASKAIAELETMGLVREVSGRKRDRQFCAEEILGQLAAVAEGDWRRLP